MKAPKLFHKNIELKNFCLSIIFMARVYSPFYNFKFKFSKIDKGYNFNFYNLTWYLFGWEVFNIGVIYDK